MGILDEIFAGNDGVTRYLHELLGGTAYFTYLSDRKPKYNVKTAEYEVSDDYETEPVPFIPFHLSSENLPYLKQDLVNKSDIVGSVPCSDVTMRLREDRDKFTYDNDTYKIIKIETWPVGDQDHRLVIYGKLIKREYNGVQ